tara:strand:+ start:220 stop:1164 length:945 start_codon:yes stop_codon:yes gene_type:complete
MKLYKGDCLIENDKIESGSVDLILTDLPYGTVNGMGGDMEKYKRLSNSNWDNVIDTNKLFKIADRILRENGKMVLTANQPFTTELISHQTSNLSHNYNMYWDKMHFANCLIANKAPVSYIEDVLIFSKNFDNFKTNPLRSYTKLLRDNCNYSRQKWRHLFGHYRFQHFMELQQQYTLCNESTYVEITNQFNLNSFDWFLEYSELVKMNGRYESVFNLWEGRKYKSNILKYKKDYDGHHPTQKPVLLLEDLIKTFSNENDLVVDFTMGSGSTGVACKNTNRNFIGIELDDKYFEIAQKRINAPPPTNNTLNKFFK